MPPRRARRRSPGVPRCTTLACLEHGDLVGERRNAASAWWSRAPAGATAAWIAGSAARGVRAGPSSASSAASGSSSRAFGSTASARERDSPALTARERHRALVGVV